MSKARKALVYYWVTTGLLGALMVASALGYLTSDFFARAFTHLGFPPYFRFELGIAKLVGVAVLLAPTPRWMKEWAYAGFTITFVSAFLAHTAVAGAQAAFPPLFALALLLVSYACLSARERAATGRLQPA